MITAVFIIFILTNFNPNYTNLALVDKYKGLTNNWSSTDLILNNPDTTNNLQKIIFLEMIIGLVQYNILFTIQIVDPLDLKHLIKSIKILILKTLEISVKLFKKKIIIISLL